MRFPRRISLTLAIAGLLTGVLACSDNTAPGTTQLSVLLKDAPGDIQEAVVTITEVDLVGSNGGQPVVLSSNEVTTDLLTLASSTATLVQDAVVPAGSYSQLRFKISGGYIKVDNGDGSSSVYATSGYGHVPAGETVTGTLQMPSEAQSGLKVTLPADALTLESGQKIILVDFDVAQSFGHEAGASGRWVMHPVITGADIQTTGTAKVSLSLADGVTLPEVNGAAVTLGDFSAVLTGPDAGTHTAALTEANGTFGATFPYLAPGDYTLSFTGPSGLTFATDPATPIAVTVTSGQPVSAAAVITAATAP